jgi:hypothetical protein
MASYDAALAAVAGPWRGMVAGTSLNAPVPSTIGSGMCLGRRRCPTLRALSSFRMWGTSGSGRTLRRGCLRGLTALEFIRGGARRWDVHPAVAAAHLKVPIRGTSSSRRRIAAPVWAKGRAARMRFPAGAPRTGHRFRDGLEDIPCVGPDAGLVDTTSNAFMRVLMFGVAIAADRPVRAASAFSRRCGNPAVDNPNSCFRNGIA